MRRPARASLADVPVLRNSDRAVAGRPRRRADGGGANDHLGQRRNPARAAIRAPRCGRLAVERADAGTRTPDPIITSDVLYQLSYVGGGSQSSRGNRGLSPSADRQQRAPLARHGARVHAADEPDVQAVAARAQRPLWQRDRPGRIAAVEGTATRDDRLAVGPVERDEVEAVAVAAEGDGGGRRTREFRREGERGWSDARHDPGADDGAAGD